MVPGGCCANRPASAFPCTAATLIDAEDTTGQAGSPASRNTETAATSPLVPQFKFTSSSSCRSSALSQASKKLNPDTPTQATRGVKGLSDCENASLPQEKPPYGHTLAIDSRSIQSAESTIGIPISRPVRPAQTSGTNRQASDISIAPRAKKIDCSPASASHGIGPRYTVSQKMWLPKNTNPATRPTSSDPPMLRPRSDHRITAVPTKISGHQPSAGKPPALSNPPIAAAVTAHRRDSGGLGDGCTRTA